MFLNIFINGGVIMCYCQSGLKLNYMLPANTCNSVICHHMSLDTLWTHALYGIIHQNYPKLDTVQYGTIWCNNVQYVTILYNIKG